MPRRDICHVKQAMGKQWALLTQNAISILCQYDQAILTDLSIHSASFCDAFCNAGNEHGVSILGSATKRQLIPPHKLECEKASLSPGNNHMQHRLQDKASRTTIGFLCMWYSYTQCTSLMHSRG